MRKLFAIAAITLLGSTAFAAGEVYRWKDGNGIWHYSDQPQAGAELVRGTGTPARPAAPTPAPVPMAAAPVAPVASGDPLPVSNEVAQQVRQEAATAKAQQCEKAKVAYEQSVQARRIYNVDAQGNRVYMTEAEIDAARLAARSNRDLACGS